MPTHDIVKMVEAFPTGGKIEQLPPVGPCPGVSEREEDPVRPEKHSTVMVTLYGIPGDKELARIVTESLVGVDCNKREESIWPAELEITQSTLTNESLESGGTMTLRIIIGV